jgi:hypothetical protein
MLGHKFEVNRLFPSSSHTTRRGHGLLRTLTGVATKQGGRGIPAGFGGGAARRDGF